MPVCAIIQSRHLFCRQDILRAHKLDIVGHGFCIQRLSGRKIRKLIRCIAVKNWPHGIQRLCQLLFWHRKHGHFNAALHRDIRRGIGHDSPQRHDVLLPVLMYFPHIRLIKGIGTPFPVFIADRQMGFVRWRPRNLTIRILISLDTGRQGQVWDNRGKAVIVPFQLCFTQGGICRFLQWFSDIAGIPGDQQCIAAARWIGYRLPAHRQVKDDLHLLSICKASAFRDRRIKDFSIFWDQRLVCRGLDRHCHTAISFFLQNFTEPDQYVGILSEYRLQKLIIPLHAVQYLLQILFRVDLRRPYIHSKCLILHCLSTGDLRRKRHAHYIFLRQRDTAVCTDHRRMAARPGDRTAFDLLRQWYGTSLFYDLDVQGKRLLCFLCVCRIFFCL